MAQYRYLLKLIDSQCFCFSLLELRNLLLTNQNFFFIHQSLDLEQSFDFCQFHFDFCCHSDGKQRRRGRMPSNPGVNSRSWIFILFLIEDGMVYKVAQPRTALHITIITSKQ